MVVRRRDEIEMKSREFVLALLAALGSVPPGLRAQGELPDLHEMALVRRPVAAALCDDGRLLCVVNQQSGSLSVVDAETRRVTIEAPFGEKLSDIAVLPDGKTVLVTDEAAQALLLVRPSLESVDVLDRLPMPRSPVNVTVCDDGRLIAVAGLWSHRVALLSATASERESEISDLRSEISDFKSEISDFKSQISDFKSENPDIGSEFSNRESLADRWEVKVVRLSFAPRMQVFV
jgi:YVTN family beta-propeller protein